MEPEFQITQDEKEMLIECIETDLKVKKDYADNDPGYKEWSSYYKEWYKDRQEHLEDLIYRIREYL
tara:strand:- start:100 stop:297 length:198 start_codon:yes stop_codon:yes gene_type:complete